MQLHVLDRRALQPLETGVQLLYAIKRNYEQFSFLPVKENSRPFLDLLGGDRIYRAEPADVRAMLESVPGRKPGICRHEAGSIFCIHRAGWDE